MDWGVYILECGDGSFYVGSTNDLDSRVGKHERGVGAKYTRGRGPFVVRFWELCGSRSDACKYESELKKLSREDKRKLFV